MKQQEWWQNRIVKYGESPASQFLAHDMNARRHPAKQREALRGSLNSLGWIAPVVVSAKTGKMLDGHARIEEALSRDDAMMVPYVEVEVSEDEERLILATLDPISALASYDKEALDALLHETSTGDAALQQLLSDLAEKHDLYFGEQPQPGAGGDDFDTAPDEEQTRVMYGDLWQCGEHRVLCGNSANVEDVERLLQGGHVSLLATDPPYGVSYVAKARDLHERGYVHSHAARDLDIDSDELEGQALIDFLKACLAPPLERSADKCALYVWHPDARRREFMAALDDLQVFIHQIVIWLKPGFVIGRCNYHHRFEPAFHGWPKGKRPEFFGERNQSNVWEVGRENDKIHPTQKPVELFERPILNHTVKGDIVYEPFAGSGTQFIAAERAGRKCYGLELEPKYVNVILSRWEAETGKAAQLLERAT